MHLHRRERLFFARRDSVCQVHRLRVAIRRYFHRGLGFCVALCLERLGDAFGGAIGRGWRVGFAGGERRGDFGGTRYFDLAHSIARALGHRQRKAAGFIEGRRFGIGLQKAAAPVEGQDFRPRGIRPQHGLEPRLLFAE